MEVALSHPALRTRSTLWVVFLATHVALTAIGLVPFPEGGAMGDLRLYRYWMWLGTELDLWPVLDVAWVYPAGALVPMRVASLGGLGAGYPIAWSLMVTALNAAALAVLLRRRNGTAAGWWWVAFLILLGPITMGRLDGVVAPIVVVALLWALDRPAVAAALLTVGAWIKVAPGALLVPLVLVTRRPLRRVVAPAAAVCVVVVAAALGLGAGERVASFLVEQGARTLQIEAPAATPWLLVAPFVHGIRLALNRDIETWEVHGPGTGLMAGLLDVLLVLAVLAAAALLWWRRERLGRRAWADRTERAELLVRGALLTTLTMLVFNKVGSPQFIGWLAPPVLVALALDLPGWRRTSRVVLAVAAATQLVFPLLYSQVTTGNLAATLVLAARNATLVALLVWTVRSLVARPDAASADTAPADAAPDEPVAPERRAEIGDHASR